MTDQTRDPNRAAGRVVKELERLIATGDLLPGQQIRQEQMAERLGVSRLPVREALRQLTAEGLVRHEHNVGYSVARLQQADLNQIYLMRAALEREVLGSLPKLDAKVLGEIRQLDAEVAAAAAAGDILAMRLKNQLFHFAMFDHSPMNLVVIELRRLWTLAMPYHAAYLYDPRMRDRVVVEHARMIEALELHDNELLSNLMDTHRHGGETSVGDMLRVVAPPVC